MKHFAITVREASSVTYFIEARNAEQAANLFDYWIMSNDGIVHDDLNRNYCGFDVDEPQEAPDGPIDSDYTDLMQAVWDELEAEITQAMKKYELAPTDAAIRTIGERVLEDCDFEHTGHFNNDDVKMTLRNYLNELINK